MSKVRNSQLIAESESIQATIYEYIENKPRLVIYESSTSKEIERILSKGIDKDLEYVLRKYPDAVSCIEEE